MAAGLEIHDAASTGDLDTLEDCLKTGKIDVNLRDEEWGNRTALHWACAKGLVECIRILLEHGASGVAVTDVGWTPAHFAAETGKLTALRALHNANIPVCVKDKYGDTPLKIAAIYGHTECVKFLELCEVVEASEAFKSYARAASALRRKRPSATAWRRSVRPTSSSSGGRSLDSPTLSVTSPPPVLGSADVTSTSPVRLKSPTSPLPPVFGSAEEEQAARGIDNNIALNTDPERES